MKYARKAIFIFILALTGAVSSLSAGSDFKSTCKKCDPKNPGQLNNRPTITTEIIQKVCPQAETELATALLLKPANRYHPRALAKTRQALQNLQDIRYAKYQQIFNSLCTLSQLGGPLGIDKAYAESKSASSIWDDPFCAPETKQTKYLEGSMEPGALSYLDPTPNIHAKGKELRNASTCQSLLTDLMEDHLTKEEKSIKMPSFTVDESSGQLVIGLDKKLKISSACNARGPEIQFSTAMACLMRRQKTLTVAQGREQRPMVIELPNKRPRKKNDKYIVFNPLPDDSIPITDKTTQISRSEDVLRAVPGVN